MLKSIQFWLNENYTTATTKMFKNCIICK